MLLSSSKVSSRHRVFKSVSAIQPAHNTDEVPFTWIVKHPINFSSFNKWMTASREGQKIWLDVFPFEQELCRDLNPDTPLFVDIGGGIGTQCRNLRTRFPDIKGRVILQDLPETIQQALPMKNVELMAHDLWTPQPVQGARIHYMRNVLLDYPDDKCRIVLHHTAAAMTKDSVILIDDMILPNKKASWQATQIDITMMSALASKERSQKQWSSLLESAGLRIAKICTYTKELQDSIVVAIPQ